MFQYFLYRVGEFLSVMLPLKCSYFMAGVVSFFQCALSKNDRLSVQGNLKVIFPGIDRKLLKRYVRGVFANFGKYLVDFLRMEKFDIDYINKNITIEGKENIDKALSENKGLIIVAAHIGNWELGGVTLGTVGYPTNAVALPHAYKSVDIFFNAKRESRGLKVIPLGRAVRNCLEAFGRNEILCLLGDRDFTQGGIVVDFFGLPTMIPRGPAIFYIKNNVPIVVGFMVREDNDKLRLFFNERIKFSPSGEYERDILELTKIYLRQIEDCIRSYPGQWYMFRRFWL